MFDFQTLLDPDEDDDLTADIKLGLVVSEAVTADELLILDQMNRSPLAGCAFFVLFENENEDGSETFANAAEAARVFCLDYLPTMAEATERKLAALDLILREYEPALRAAAGSTS